MNVARGLPQVYAAQSDNISRRKATAMPISTSPSALQLALATGFRHKFSCASGSRICYRHDFGPVFYTATADAQDDAARDIFRFLHTALADRETADNLVKLAQ